ncbi:DUF4245 domain-containing protein [Kytococcus schroeteri]|nr:DUF4245 domain-containing protein [Kytococcus schroeteri]
MTDPAVQPSPPPRRRGMGSWRSMLWSSLIVVAIVLVWWAMVAMPDRVPERTVDVRQQTATTERETGRDIVEAVGLSGEWRATHAQLRTDGTDKTWHVTFSTPQGRHLSLDQRLLGPEGERAGLVPWAEGKTGTGEYQGEIEADGRTWRTTLRPDPERRGAVLLDAPDDSAVVVSGDASEDELRALVEALRFDGAPRAQSSASASD